MKVTRHLAASAVISIFLLTISSFCGEAKTKKIGDGFRNYSVENAGVGRDGTYVLKVTTTADNPDSELEITIKNAVHAVLFKGIPAGTGFSATPPLAGSASAESDNAAFFEAFFVSDYKQYVKTAAKSSMVIVRQKDKSFSTTAVVSILKDDLRRCLEDNGIIRKMVL